MVQDSVRFRPKISMYKYQDTIDNCKQDGARSSEIGGLFQIIWISRVYLSSSNYCQYNCNQKCYTQSTE